MTVASRLPGILLVSLVLVAAALLIAGYGFAVGVGLVLGVILGLAAVLALFATGRRSSGGVWSSGGVSGSIAPADQELMMRHGREWQALGAVDSAPLRRVIAVGSASTAEGVTLELVSIEIREDGLIATFAARTRPPTGPLGHFGFGRVADDAATGYTASIQETASSGPGGSRYELRAAPRPPDVAHSLTIEVTAFVSPFPGQASRIDGLWRFVVEL